jgi:tetratricopeptide (TPR) repeat protein
VSEWEGDYEAAWAFFSESLSLRREMGDRWGIAQSIDNMAVVARKKGDYAAARALHEESLSIFREVGEWHGVAYALDNLGIGARKQGNYAAARAYLEESLVIRRHMRDRLGITRILKELAKGEAIAGRADLAVRLSASAAALFEAMGVNWDAEDLAEWDCCLADLRDRIGAEAYVKAWAEGRSMSLDEAIAAALGEEAPHDVET